LVQLAARTALTPVRAVVVVVVRPSDVVVVVVGLVVEVVACFLAFAGCVDAAVKTLGKPGNGTPVDVVVVVAAA
jgi:hypothetical protein